MNRHEYDIPIIRSTVSIRSPRAVTLLQPVLVPTVLLLLVLSVVFTIWPEALNHTPISFETRGFVHHAWHYTLFAGSLLTTIGLFVNHRRRLQIELSGLCLLVGALTMNAVALIADSTNLTPDEAPFSGLGMALRVGLIVGLLIRAYTVAIEPTVQVPSIRPNEGR